jgi:tetratricopeptide (TPR) repeat protein
MRRIRSIPLCLTLLVLYLCEQSPAAPTSPWLEVHSNHFTVITDGGDKVGKEVALRFEQMRAVFANLIAKDRLSEPTPLTILAFGNDRSYYQLAPLRRGPSAETQPIDVPGFFLHGEDQNFIVLNLSEPESWRAVAYEFAHMLLNSNYPPAQGWFDEGLAEYFSSIHVDDRQVEIGGDPEAGASANQNSAGASGAAQPARSLIEVLQDPHWLSIPELFATKHAAFNYNKGLQNDLFHAESWIVMHYLIHEKKLPETGTYLGLVVVRHLRIEEAIQQAYGMSPTELEKAVRDYFQAQSPTIVALDTGHSAPDVRHPSSSTDAQQFYQFPVSVHPEDSAIISKPLPEADARALCAEVAIRIPERRESGLKELQELATTPTLADKKSQAKTENTKKSGDSPGGQLPTDAIGDAMAHRILAWDHIAHGDFEDAITELGDAAALNRDDMWIRYYLCVLKYRSAQARHGEIQGLANMMMDLKSVLEWYPQMASAYDLLALARNAGGTTNEAMQSERAAMMLSPRNELYAYHLALIYISGKKWEAAQAELDRVKGGDDPQVAALARQQLDQVANERKYGAVGANAKQNFEPQKTPFDVLDEDAAKRAAAEQAAESSGEDMRPTKYFRGRLVDVDCSQTPAAVLTIASGESQLKLRAADYKSLLLIGADEFSCAWHNLQVTANYKPGGMNDGDLISLEVR